MFAARVACSHLKGKHSQGQMPHLIDINVPASLFLPVRCCRLVVLGNKTAKRASLTK